jgi:hypothetical protein
MKGEYRVSGSKNQTEHYMGLEMEVWYCIC